MKKLLIFFILLFNSYSGISQQYTAVPNTYSENGGGTWGSILKILCITHADGTGDFYIRKINGDPFSSSGTMYLKVGGHDVSNVTRASVHVSSGDYVAHINTDFTQFSGYPKEFYGRFVSDASGYAWAGPITIHEPASPSVTSVSPNSAILGQSVTFTINGANLTNDIAFFIPNFGSGTVNSSTNTTRKTFTISSSDSNGIKHGVIKDRSGGNVIYNFDVNVYFPTPTNLTASVQSSTQINLSWNSVSNAYQYKLYRSTSSGGTYSEIYSGNNTSYSHTGLNPHTTYYYRVQACQASNQNSCSSQSNYISATTSSAANQQPDYPNMMPIPSGQTITVNQQTTIPIRSGSDPDGDRTRIKVYYPNTSTLVFTSSLSATSQTYNVPITFTQTGTQRVYSRTYDEHGLASATPHRDYTVVAQTSNSAPNQATFNSLPNPIYLNQSVYFNIHSGTDPDNDQVRLKVWATGSNHSSESNAILSNYENGGSSFAIPLLFSQLGNQTVYVKTVDSNGAESSVNSTSINVTDNTVGPTEVVIGNITFTADVINETSNGIYSLQGNVQANNILKFTGTLTVNTNNYSIDGNGRVFLSDIPSLTNHSNLVDIDLYNGNFSYSVNGALAQLQSTGINYANEVFEMAHFPVHINYIKLLSDGIEIDGSLKLPSVLNHTEVEIDNIRVTRSSGVDLIGHIALNNIGLNGRNSYSLSGSLDFDTNQNNFTGTCNLNTPTFGIESTVVLENNLLDSVDINYTPSPPGTPLGGTGLFITNAGGSLTNINGQGGNITATLYMSLAPMGASDIIEFRNVHLTYVFYDDLFSGGGSFTVLNTELANASFCVEQNKFHVEANANFYNVVTGLCKLDIMKISNETIVWGHFNATVQIPDNSSNYTWRVNRYLNALKGAGMQLPYQIAAVDHYYANGSLSGSTNIMINNVPVEFSYSMIRSNNYIPYFTVNWNELTSLLNSSQTNRLEHLAPPSNLQYRNTNTQRASIGSLIVNPTNFTQNRAARTPITIDFLLPANAKNLIITVKPNTSTGTLPTYSITKPDGTVINQGNIGSYANITYTEYAQTKEAFYIIHNAQQGAWQININDDGQTYLVDLDGITKEPGIAIRNIQRSGDNITVNWLDHDDEFNGQISLYYDIDNDGLDGTLIATGISEDADGANGSYTFNVSNLQPGQYYVYAVMHNENTSVSSYSSDFFTVGASLIAPTNLTSIINTDNSVTLNWNKIDNLNDKDYIVYYEADANVSYSSPHINAGNANNYILRNLDPIHTYNIMVVAKQNEILGEKSNTVQVEFTKTQTINLQAGWNLVSFYVTPEDLTIQNVTASINSSLLEIRNETQSYDPNLPAQFNTLHNIEVGKGYWIKVNQATTFDITGSLVDITNLSINLQQGWNLVAFPKQATQDVESALNSISNHLLEVRNATQSYDPSLPAQFNTLDHLTPGEGYWIKVNQNCILTF